MILEIIRDHQCGFRHHRSTIDQIYSILFHRYWREKWDFKGKYINYLYISKKAYDSVKREDLYNTRIEFGIRLSTAVEQVVACALVTQRARVRSPVGTGFLGEVFSEFFLTCKTNVPEYHLAVAIIIPYSPCWDDCVCALVCIVFHVCAVSEVAPALG